MTKEIEIEIVNTELENLGIDQEPGYATLYFNSNKLSGYWISGEGETITFYLESLSFICKNNEANRKILYHILLNS